MDVKHLDTLVEPKLGPNTYFRTNCYGEKILMVIHKDTRAGDIITDKPWEVN
jgi:hypothetical protein